jgi:hypothetical protein
MTEAEWLACQDHTQLMSHLVWESGGRGVSDRKLRLSACACCRSMWDEFPHEGCRRAVIAAEDYADRLVSEEELGRAHEEISKWPVGDMDFTLVDHDEWAKVPANRAVMVAYMAAGNLGGETTAAGLSWLMQGTLTASEHTPGRLVEFRSSQGRAAQSDGEIVGLLRDIFGNPFRPVTFLPEWHTSTVVALAQQMYDSRDFSAMPILADALQDAGCASDDILDHCRGAGPHVRGCWVVDLVLGKQ